MSELNPSPNDLNQSPGDSVLDATANIVSSFASSNALPKARLLDLIAEVHAALTTIVRGANPRTTDPLASPLKPAIAINKSVTQEFIVCLEDGLKFKSMKRHLKGLGMTPQQYRMKWGLPSDYPMVAANYTAKRSALAREAGLGRGRPRGRVDDTEPTPTE